MNNKPVYMPGPMPEGLEVKFTEYIDESDHPAFAHKYLRHGARWGYFLSKAPELLAENEHLKKDAVQLATLLDEMISHMPFDAWETLEPDLIKLGHKPTLLKYLRDKYADRYRNV